MLILALIFFHHSSTYSIQESKRNALIPIKLKPQKLYQSEDSVIYKVSDLNGHLSPLGIETAIHSVVEVRKNGIFIIDPGPHPRYASEILKSIANIHGKELPNVRWVFNSTGKPENVLGNSAFVSKKPLFMSSKVTAEVMKNKCEECRKDLFSVIPENGLMQEIIVIPTYIVEDEKVLHPQLLDWRTYTFDCAKSTGDSVLWNKRAGILYAGRMVHSGNLPSLLHANTKEWIKSLQTLEELNPKYVLGSGTIFYSPGYQNAFNNSDIKMTRRYLSDLLALIQNDFNSGGNGSDADKRLSLIKFKNSLGYSRRHGLNVQHVWREFEIAEFGDEKVCNKNLPKYSHDHKHKTVKVNKDFNNIVQSSITEIGKNTFVFTGYIDDFSKKNFGHISNYGFVVGEECVAVIDTGGSKKTGMALLKFIRKTTTKPICYVINTHAHPDHIGGNTVFFNLNPKPEFIAHHKFEGALSSRYKFFNKRMQELMGLDNVVVPEPLTRRIKDNFEIDLGDRKLFLKAWKTAHTDNDLTVFDIQNKVLWAGDLLFVDHIPVLDGNLSNWIKTTEELIKPSHKGSNGMYVNFIIPGHGSHQKTGSSKLLMQQNYLVKLYKLTKKAISDGLTISQAVKKVSEETMGNWNLSDLFIRRNVTAAYAELEWE